MEKANSDTTVVVGMSGGVDSSVAAILLKEQGYNVVGMFMRNWDEQDPDGECMAITDYNDVISVCEQLDIPYYAVDFVKEYWDNVFEGFVQDYKKGLTPNPDILCNSEIKFNVFLEKAMELGADYLATGHYCRLRESKLVKGEDPGKDQSYFLYNVDGAAFTKVLFPVGELLKSEVRKIAEDHDISTKAKKDSTGICFIGERNFREFLSTYVGIKEGNLQTLSGKVVGKHQGMAFYTLGQRKGLGIGAMKESNGKPWFVVGKNVEENIVLVEQGTEHPALYADYLIANDMNWISPIEDFPYDCQGKIRYRQKDQECQIQKISDTEYKISFTIPQRAIAPGQSVVLYQGELCLGGGIITEVGPTYYHQKKDLPEVIAL